MEIRDLPTGMCSVTLILRNGEKRRVRGKITEKRGQRYFLAKQSPKKSYGPGTRVLRCRK